MDEIKLIALDMDGTLLNNEEEVSDYTKEVIAKAMAKKVHVVLSTGRWLESCYPYAALLKLDSYLVTVNGGQIWTMEKEMIEQHLLDPKYVKMMYELAEQMDMNIWMISTDRVWHGKGPEDFFAYEWLKFGCDSLDSEKLTDLVEELSHYEELELTNSLPNNIEVNPKGVNKANAVRKVCDSIGISMNNVMAVGDSLNDIKAIQQSGLGVAMDNGQEAIKKVADYVTDTNNNDGVAKAIQRFVL